MNKLKVLSILSHASIFLSSTLVSVGIPLTIFFVTGDETVKANARESLNFHFNVWLYGIIIGILTFLTFGLLGFILGPILLLITLIMPILAIIQVSNNPETAFRYPFIFRLL
ncbi:DUF4870 domain-containing protein [Gloeocapsa sp. PCC 73106]|uniref:DUF4870 domain-containing protein n=1 Tax=Gloeocapsa sp. PCC 73106 TaxID=102232 RepID=UPI0002ACB9E3|nr:DUF4870 domain-containing protein [Gloeocapsa sp. PCC 73106]ELR98542.1 hypothetical protein GLO73106DRAFT_00023760 [Gloeocapsa sp. PCC 73106]